ncbi:hypothetical protein FRC03_009037 [Tulasnella sp. 419]|nr:hypothetical protein FRC03_009037 [Tulasnella sp. 419]
MVKSIPEDQMPPLINFPDLTTLKVGGKCDYCMDVWTWLAHLDCPRLSELAISPNGVSAWKWSIPETMQARRLQTLYLRPLQAAGYIDYALGLAPSVTHLIIPEHRATEMVSSLSRDLRSLGPNLAEIRIALDTMRETVVDIRSIEDRIIDENPEVKVMVLRICRSDMLGR